MHRLICIELLVVSTLSPADPVAAQTFTTLHSFPAVSGPLSNNQEGAHPVASLMAASNILFGTASRGGTGGTGTIFAMDAEGGGFTNLHSFAPVATALSTNSEGAYPVVGLFSSGGVLYGATSGGGFSGAGTVFKVNLDGSGFTTLHQFTAMTGPLFANSDGAHPVGILLAGNTLYGTARDGGMSGNGTVFAMNTDGGGFMALHSFSAAYYHPSGYYTNSDGANPLAGLVLAKGTLFGTAVYGGRAGQGTVFAVHTDGNGFTNLHSFPFGTPNLLGIATNSDGMNPSSTLIIAGQTLYGTAQNGGELGQGTAFAMDSDGSHFTTLHRFSLLSDGGNPVAGLVLAGSMLYGVANLGGSGGAGSLFAMNTNGTGFTNLHNFDSLSSSTNRDGANPVAGLVFSGNNLFGVTYQGGASGSGTLFSLSLGSASPPLLSINRSGEKVILAWATNADGFSLQIAPTLTPPVFWTNALDSPVIVDGHYTVTNGILDAQRLYRLIR